MENRFEKISTECNHLTEARLRSSTVFDSLTQVLKIFKKQT